MKRDRSPEAQATGIAENPHGLGKLYADGGRELTTDEAQDLILDGKGVDVPNAGAGSYKKFFRLMKYAEVRVIEWTSSSGDWTFAVAHGEDWHIAWQSNRYPHHGFRYSVDDMPYPSFEAASEGAMQ